MKRLAMLVWCVVDVVFHDPLCGNGGNATRNSKKLVELLTLLAPREKRDFLHDYNPGAIYPYYCIINENRIVTSRGAFGHKDWQILMENWIGKENILVHDHRNFQPSTS